MLWNVTSKWFPTLVSQILLPIDKMFRHFLADRRFFSISLGSRGVTPRSIRICSGGHQSECEENGGCHTAKEAAAAGVVDCANSRRCRCMTASAPASMTLQCVKLSRWVSAQAQAWRSFTHATYSTIAKILLCIHYNVYIRDRAETSSSLYVIRQRPPWQFNDPVYMLTTCSPRRHLPLSSLCLMWIHCEPWILVFRKRR